VAWLIGINKIRLLMLLAILALLFSTACWASVFNRSYGHDSAGKEKMFSARTAGAPDSSARSTHERAGLVTAYDGAQGIQVRASGSVAGEPDIAVISLGVESVEDTASEARANAAAAMAGVMQVLDEAGIEDRDIQTKYFNISPRYQNVRVTECEDEEAKESSTDEENCTTSWELKLIGYAVTNQASVKIRDLDEAGTIIDQVTDAAGDLVRVNGINFSIEDPEALREEARAKAIKALQQKAETMAELAGVTLGRLVRLEESTDFLSPQPVYARAAFAFAAESAADTSISAGEIEVTTFVSGVYLIVESSEE
jgi:uncharacterized protein YggE